MTPSDRQYTAEELDVEPESQPPPADPGVREALDRMEDEHELPDAEDAADRDEDETDEPVDQAEEGEADEGEEAPSG